MHTIQSFLTVVLCGFVWLTIILGLALAGEVTIYDKDWRVVHTSIHEQKKGWKLGDTFWGHAR
jgi:hypothetical protein